MNQTRRKFIHLGVLGGSTISAGRKILAAPESKKSETTPAFYQAAADKIRPLFQTKKPAQPGDWLADQKEPGQTFARYLTIDPSHSSPRQALAPKSPKGRGRGSRHHLIGSLAG